MTGVNSIPVRVAGLAEESTVDGPGYRLVVFAQGCPHSCGGCHNQHALDFAGGYETTTSDIMRKALNNPLLAGITLSGGEPFAQAGAFAAIAKCAREHSLNVITYTGYTIEQLLAGLSDNLPWRELLQYTDILVDGPFELDRVSPLLKFRGSDNQRIIDPARSLAEGQAVETDFDCLN